MAAFAYILALTPRAAPGPCRLPRRARFPRAAPTSFPPSGKPKRNPSSRAVFDPSQASQGNNQYKYDQAEQYQQGSNVYHAPQSGNDRRNANDANNATHGSMSNPGDPDYLPHLASTRQRFIDQEASAVRVRDYPVAARSARILLRLVEIERDLLIHETREMEASLAQDYQSAAVSKRKKDALLEEFYDLRFDRYDDATYDDEGLIRGGGQGATRSSSDAHGGSGAHSGTTHSSTYNNVSSGTVSGDGSSKASLSDGQKGQKKKSSGPPLLVPVRFTVNVQPQFGEGVVVCGDAPELGAWDGSKGVKMDYKLETKLWSCTVGVPQSSSFKFKFVVVGGLSEEEEKNGVERALYWQEGDDRHVTLPFEDALSLDVVVDWEGDRDKERMWLCMPVPRALPEK